MIKIIQYWMRLSSLKTIWMFKKSLRDIISSVHSVMSDSLRPHESQHARPPCPSSTPRVHSNSCPLSQWCHPTISSSVLPFSSHLQSFPASGSFPRSQFFISGGQRIAVSASASVLPMNIQGWFSLGLTGLISLLSRCPRISATTHTWPMIPPPQHRAYNMMHHREKQPQKASSYSPESQTLLGRLLSANDSSEPLASAKISVPVSKSIKWGHTNLLARWPSTEAA